jgi:hypothetical protein
MVALQEHHPDQAFQAASEQDGEYGPSDEFSVLTWVHNLPQWLIQPIGNGRACVSRRHIVSHPNLDSLAIMCDRTLLLVDEATAAKLPD